MKKILNRLADRLLSRLGFDFDVPINMRGNAFDQITKNLFVGARPRSADIPALKEAGITHIISCLREEERPHMAFLQEDFQTLFLAIRDSIQEDIASKFPACFAFADQAQTSHPEAKILIHCEVGVSRSATLAIAYLMQSERKNFLEAFGQVRARRPGVLPNIGFASHLQRLEHELFPGMCAPGEPSSLSRYLHQICNAPVELEVLQEALERHDYDALQAIQMIFGDIPRVIQGVRL